MRRVFHPGAPDDDPVREKPLQRLAYAKSPRISFDQASLATSAFNAALPLRAVYSADASVMTTRKPMLRKSKPKLSKSGFVAVRFAERQ